MTEHRNRQGQNPERSGGFAMFAMTVVCCMVVVLLLFLIPVVGWPFGLTIGAVGFVAMLFVHQRTMGHGSHH